MVKNDKPSAQPRYLSGCLLDGVCRGVCKTADCPNYDMVVAARIVVEPKQDGVAYPESRPNLKNAAVALRAPAQGAPCREALLAAQSALNNPLNMNLRDRAFRAINLALTAVTSTDGGTK